MPISLVGSLYIWLAKVLAHGLKRVLAKVVSKAQNPFIEGRQILDANIVANEAVDSILRRNEGAILCKLYLEKAYDHVDWSFLCMIMENMVFFEESGYGGLDGAFLLQSFLC